MRTRIAIAVCVGAALAGAATTLAVEQTGLQKQNEILFQQLQQVFHLTDLQMTNIRGIFARSGYMGQGNPAITVHPLTPAQCQAKLGQALAAYENPEFEKICGAKYMAPLYDAKTQKPSDAKACIDQFEFPDIRVTGMQPVRRPN